MTLTFQQIFASTSCRRSASVSTSTPATQTIGSGDTGFIAGPGHRRRRRRHPGAGRRDRALTARVIGVFREGGPLTKHSDARNTPMGLLLGRVGHARRGRRGARLRPASSRTPNQRSSWRRVSSSASAQRARSSSVGTGSSSQPNSLPSVGRLMAWAIRGRSPAATTPTRWALPRASRSTMHRCSARAGSVVGQRFGVVAGVQRQPGRVDGVVDLLGGGAERVESVDAGEALAAERVGARQVEPGRLARRHALPRRRPHLGDQRRVPVAERAADHLGLDVAEHAAAPEEVQAEPVEAVLLAGGQRVGVEVVQRPEGGDRLGPGDEVADGHGRRPYGCARRAADDRRPPIGPSLAARGPADRDVRLRVRRADRRPGR